MYARYFLFLLLVGIAGCGGETERESSAIGGSQVTAASFNQEGAPTVEFNVPDMMCPDGCGVAVKEILVKQPGVEDVFVDFDGKIAKVAIEEGKFDSDKALAALVDKQFLNSSLKAADGVKTQDADSAAVH